MDGSLLFCPVFRRRTPFGGNSRVLTRFGYVADNQRGLFCGESEKAVRDGQSCPLALPKGLFEGLKVVFWQVRTNASASPNGSFGAAEGAAGAGRGSFLAALYPPCYTATGAGSRFLFVKIFERLEVLGCVVLG